MDEAADGADTLAVAHALGDLAGLLGRADVRRRLAGERAVALSVNDVNLLRAVVASGPLRAGDLAAVQGVDKSTVTPRIQRLERQGLLIREASAEDRRAQLLRASGSGCEMVASIDATARSQVESVIDAWPAEQRDLVLAHVSDFLVGLVQVLQR